MGEVTEDPDRPGAKLSAPEPLTPDHDLSGFDCGEPALNEWLTQRALKNESRFSRTYVVCEERRVVACVSISAGGVVREAAPGKLRRNAPDTIPLSIIGRLAVDRNFAGRGLGADMLAEALRRIEMASRSIGIAAVLVHAKNEQARSFYLAHARFTEYPAESNILFLPIEAVVANFR